MFNVSLSDRLKAAVNTLEQTGSSLQARAIGQPQSPSSSTGGAGASIARATSPAGASPRATGTGTSVHASGDAEGIATSPTRNYSTSQLAENALSGLRKSFHFAARDGTTAQAQAGRTSSDGAVTVGGTQSRAGPQELKDITSPTQPAGGPSSSRPSSPAPVSGKFLFALGNDTPSVTGTPRPRSPNPPVPSSLGPKHTPNPDDPASYPLPPSPTSASSALPLLSPAPPGFADPLGASPSLAPQRPPDPPSLRLSEEVGHAKGNGAQEQIEADADNVNGNQQAESASAGAGITPAMQNDVVVKVEEAAKRYEDMSIQYAALVAQVESANKVIKELTPLETGITDAEALEGWVRMKNGKVDMITDELKRLQDKLALQDSRIEELRDTHRLEGSSQSELVTKLRSQLSTAESNVASKAAELMQLGQLRTDLSKAQTVAKEEEEKRTKAVSLLKTVRMKLTKAEKDREEVERDRAEERAERSRAVEESERIKADREREVNALRKGFERELAGVKERYEKDLQAKKAAWELEMITTKASHAKELSSRMTQVSGLEAIVKELNISKQHQFATLEARQSEVETARAEMERMQNSTKELEYQLRETTERCSLLEDQVNARSGTDGARRGRLDVASRGGTPSPSPSRQNSGVDVQRLLAEAEQRSEAKISDLRFKIRSLENERNDAEEEWALKLQERVRELEKLRRAVTEKEGEYADALRESKDKDGRAVEAEERYKGLERELAGLKAKMLAAEGDTAASADAERILRDEISGLQSQISALNTQLDESRNLTTQLRQTNKTLREEMRKVQSSVQLMERSRNPGVGYWSSSSNGPNGVASGSGSGAGAVPAPPRSGITSPDSASVIGTPTKESRRSLESESLDTRGSPAPSEASKPPPANEEEEVNLEYLRNVILQFLEHKEMRPNLVRVLSVILRFTPQELRRLNAKLLT